jgi:predicted secreted hydrolase
MNEKIKPIKLPEDNGPHENTIEWWYFNGHLKDKDGNQYSFMDCLFKVDFLKANLEHLFNFPSRSDYQKGNYLYFAHSVVSDIARQKNYKEIQNISLMAHYSFSKEKFFASYTNPSIFEKHICEIEEKEKNGFRLKTENLELVLESRKKPLLEGGHGYVGTIEDGSYYYSLTDMRAKGVLKIEGKEIAVSGQTWMDHQWANAVYKKDKWTWFSIQLENGTELMCVEYDTKKGSDILINLIDKEGKQSQYIKAIFKQGKNIWESKKTKAKYPLAWQIEIPEAQILIEAHSLMSDQEMIFGPINYWEGPIAVVAKINGAEVRGEGFMELVGYPSEYNYLFLAGEEIEENISKKIKKFFGQK